MLTPSPHVQATAGRRTFLALLALFTSTAAMASGGDDNIFLGLSVTGDGIAPSAAEALAHPSPLKPVELGVSAQQGAASYSVPISLPPAVLMPALSLDYTSSAGPHSPLGRGWNLSSGGLTISRILGQEAAQAYGDEPITPFRVDGMVSGLLFDRSGWELHSGSPTVAVIERDVPGNTWTLTTGGVTAHLRADPGGDTWSVAWVTDAYGNQVVYDRSPEDGVLESVAYGGRAGAGPGSWVEGPLYRVEVRTEAAPTASYRGHTDGVAVLDRRVVGFELDVDGACDSGADCADTVLPVWDLCYAPLVNGAGEEQLAEVYLRADVAETSGCESGETETARRLVALDYTAWEPDATAAVLSEGPGPLGLSHTDRYDATYQWIDLADANGDGWMDRFDWSDGGSGVQTMLADGVPHWDLPGVRDFDPPFRIGTPAYLGASRAAITGVELYSDTPFSYFPTRTRYVTQKWVDLDGDGFRDLITATLDPISLRRTTDEDDLPAPAFFVNLNLDDDGDVASWDWLVHFGRPWGLDDGVRMEAPFKFPQIGDSPGHKPINVVDHPERWTVSDLGTTFIDLLDLTGDGYADVVEGVADGIHVYPFLPAADRWDDTPELYPTAGLHTLHLERTTHHVVNDSALWGGEREEYQAPRTEYTEVTLRLVDLNGDGHLDVVDTDRVAGMWSVALGQPGGFDDVQTLWPAPLPYMTRSYEGRPLVSTCGAPGIASLPGGIDPYGDDLMIPPATYVGSPTSGFGGGGEIGGGDADTDTDTDSDTDSDSDSDS
ncbi:MAG: hypothetical protein ACI8PZ_007516, partial [Myxococcota bacterium]